MQAGFENIDDFRLELGASSELGMAIALASMMFAVALNLKPSSFAFIKDSPRSFVVGMFGQIVALPLMTVLVCMLLNPHPSIALGMILVACCPGGNVSNMMVLLSRGNTALSITLTATSSIAAAFVTPLAIIFWSSLYAPTADLLTRIEFDEIDFLIKTAIVLAVPLCLGVLINTKFESLSQKIRQPLVYFAAFLLLVIVVRGFAMYWSDFVALGAGLIGLVVLHNSAAFLTGNALARLARLNETDRRAVTFEVGLQNVGLAIVILLTQLGGLGGAAAVAGLWGTWHMVAGGALVYYFRRSDGESVA